MLDLNAAQKNDGSISFSVGIIVVLLTKRDPEIEKTILDLNNKYTGIKVFTATDGRIMIEIKDERVWDASVIAEIVYKYLSEEMKLTISYNPDDFKS